MSYVENDNLSFLLYNYNIDIKYFEKFRKIFEFKNIHYNFEGSADYAAS